MGGTGTGRGQGNERVLSGTQRRILNKVTVEGEEYRG